MVFTLHREAFGLEIIFILRNQTKGWCRIHNRLCFPLLVVKFAIDGFCIIHDPKEIKKKTRFKIGGNLGSFGITHDSKEAK